VEHLVVSYSSCFDSEAGSSIASRREAGADVAHFPPTPPRVARVALSARTRPWGRTRRDLAAGAARAVSRGRANRDVEQGGALLLLAVGKRPGRCGGWSAFGSRRNGSATVRAGELVEACGGGSAERGEARDRWMAARRRRRVFGFARFHEVSGPHRSGQDPNRSESNG